MTQPKIAHSESARVRPGNFNPNHDPAPQSQALSAKNGEKSLRQTQQKPSPRAKGTNNNSKGISEKFRRLQSKTRSRTAAPSNIGEKSPQTRSAKVQTRPRNHMQNEEPASGPCQQPVRVHRRINPFSIGPLHVAIRKRRRALDDVSGNHDTGPKNRETFREKSRKQRQQIHGQKAQTGR